MRGNNHDKNRQLYKNPDQAKVCGVCAGIADYFDFEVWVVRLITITLLLLGAFNGIVVIGYIVLCFVLDPKPGSKSNKGCFGKEKKRHTSRYSQVDEASKPYRSSVKDVWKSGTSPKDTLEEIEGKFSNIERKLQGMETFVTSNQYELEKKFRDIDN
ncbi:MAG: envelope stress response membrane protein PspC [Flavobacteriales bacterium]|nr:envelope stress response membrane protein PspC [Flavobacteriales bacterium]